MIREPEKRVVQDHLLVEDIEEVDPPPGEVPVMLMMRIKGRLEDVVDRAAVVQDQGNVIEIGLLKEESQEKEKRKKRRNGPRKKLVVCSKLVLTFLQLNLNLHRVLP